MSVLMLRFLLSGTTFKWFKDEQTFCPETMEAGIISFVVYFCFLSFFYHLEAATSIDVPAFNILIVVEV